MKIGKGFVIPFRLTFLMWLVFTLEHYFHLELAFLGIFPREIPGLIGIITAPLIHGNLIHLTANTVPLLFLGTVLFLFYDKIALRVFYQTYFITNILVWIFARPSFHIGASGLVYGIAFFLISFGIFRKEFQAILISMVVIFFYGGLVYGVFPRESGVSWESHLMGAIVGVVTALTLSKKKSVQSR